jgi:mono/diheme cytochrome c family protein
MSSNYRGRRPRTPGREHSSLHPVLLIALVVVLTGCDRPTLANLTETAVVANPPTVVGTPDPALAPERGQSLFVSQCAACHAVDGSGRSAGPDIKGMAERVEAVFPGRDLVDYMHESIVDIHAYVPDGYHGDVMPANYAETLSEQQIDDLVAYMMSIQ